MLRDLSTNHCIFSPIVTYDIVIQVKKLLKNLGN